MWRQDSGRPLTAALEALGTWLLQQHRAAHGASARASDIVLVLQFCPFGAAVLGRALERTGAALPPVRVADSCLLAKYAQSQLAPPAAAADGAGAGGASTSSQPLLLPAAPADPSETLNHDAGLRSLVARFAPAWLPRASWYPKPGAGGGAGAGAADALADARTALVMTRALSGRVWGDEEEWRAFALGMSAPLADVLGRAGYPDAGRAVDAMAADA